MSLLAAAVLAIGIGVSGWFVADGLREARAGDRFVTVVVSTIKYVLVR